MKSSLMSQTAVAARRRRGRRVLLRTVMQTVQRCVLPPLPQRPLRQWLAARRTIGLR